MFSQVWAQNPIIISNGIGFFFLTTVSIHPDHVIRMLGLKNTGCKLVFDCG